MSMDAPYALDELLIPNAFKHTNAKTNVEEVYNFDDSKIQMIKDMPAETYKSIAWLATSSRFEGCKLMTENHEVIWTNSYINTWINSERDKRGFEIYINNSSIVTIKWYSRITKLFYNCCLY